ncbi:MAG: hypothetical protein BGN98_13810 [Microbacterium sp. 69-7]|uniref:LuxR C-terminal-related transcriptional regulator n=1 Tax=Microbacterium sp. 69-7 TaxID=1895784 RepID=UPI000965233F|nr:LuxR C-terminal-related transcriptional regulator [Microbacterium sp. 69-7]OJU44456.1 MAG: hypothetical protein BGN98_13810 [Microbacterium sp. 69-7]
MDLQVRELILALYDGGLAEADIAAELKARGIRFPPGGNHAASIRRAIRDRHVLSLVAGGMTRKQVAEHLGVNEKTVDRAFENMRTRVAKPYTPQELERIYALVEEGMPISFIAEDIGRSGIHLRERFDVNAHRPADAVLEWKRTWSAIRRSPELLELHRQFHPKKEKV